MQKKRWRRHFNAAMCLLCSLVATRALVAQLQPSIPPPGDPEVWIEFLRTQDSLYAELQEKKSKDPAAGQTMERVLTSKLRSTTLAQISTVYRAARSDMDAVARQYYAYRDEMFQKKQRPDVKKLSAFESRRKQIITAAIDKLHSKLPADQWKALADIVDGSFRKSARRVEIQ